MTTYMCGSILSLVQFFFLQKQRKIRIEPRKKIEPQHIHYIFGHFGPSLFLGQPDSLLFIYLFFYQFQIQLNLKIHLI